MGQDMVTESGGKIIGVDLSLSKSQALPASFVRQIVFHTRVVCEIAGIAIVGFMFDSSKTFLGVELVGATGLHLPRPGYALFSVEVLSQALKHDRLEFCLEDQVDSTFLDKDMPQVWWTVLP